MPVVSDIQGGFRKGFVFGIFFVLFIGILAMVAGPYILKKLILGN